MPNLSDPLFKGATRPAMMLGVPVYVLGGSIGVFMLFAIWTGLWLVLLFWFPLFLVMRAMAARDEQAFRVLSISLLHKARTMKNRFAWGQVAYGDDHYVRRNLPKAKIKNTKK